MSGHWRPMWRTRVFLWVWEVVWTLGLPLIRLYLRRRARADPMYAAHLGERLGTYPVTLDAAVWVHAVSLGEVRSAVPLVAALLARGERVVTTHFTPAGRREAERVFAADIAAGRLVAAWVPLETTRAYRRFLAAFRPRYGLVMEIEIWPRMVRAADRAGVPLFMCNAQYPSQSIARDAKGWGLRRDVMCGFAGAFVKSDLQADRFAAVGVRNIHVTGELRFDQPVPPAQIAAAERVVSADRPVICFASVVEGEDDLYLDVIKRLLAGPRPPRIVYVPRQQARFDAVAGMMAARGLRVARRSELFDAGLRVTGPTDWDVLLGDSMGEMYFYLALASRVVVGGGFTPHGAHNIIEPLALRRPVLVGPHIHTIEYPATEAIAAGVCRHVGTAESLFDALLGGWPGPTEAEIAAFFAAHAGATARTLAALPAALAATSR